MPWIKRSSMDERTIFIAACLRREASLAVICSRHGISRKTGSKWLARYRAEGVAGLCSLSSARHGQAHAISPEIAARLLALRGTCPSWGPRKLLARLALDDAAHAAALPKPGVPGSGVAEAAAVWPAASTVGDLLRRHHVTRQRARRPPPAGTKAALSHPTAPNQNWAIDFKGWFRTGDGVRCEPLTLTDGFSRYILVCKAMPQITTAHVQPELIAAFRAHGMPQALRSDNGSPFANANSLAGLTRLSVWLLSLNIWPERIDPGRPDQNGRHERMHRVLHEDAASPPSATLALQQQRLDTWRIGYNTYRPHEALGQVCPASLFAPSARTYPEESVAWEYPADHHVRQVSAKGYIKWRDGTVYLTEALRGQTVALAQEDDGDWRIQFRQFGMAVLCDATGRIRQGQLRRRDAGLPGPTSAEGLPP